MTAKRILIIDDDADFCEELEEALRSEGFFSESAQDAVKGEDLIRSGAFDTILLDYKMPLLAGIDIIKNLKADNIVRHIFIVSGRPSIEQTLKEEGLLDVVSGIIAKPIDFDAMLEKIKES